MPRQKIEGTLNTTVRLSPEARAIMEIIADENQCSLNAAIEISMIQYAESKRILAEIEKINNKLDEVLK